MWLAGAALNEGNGISNRWSQSNISANLVEQI
jgi:hypothetical protein